MSVSEPSDGYPSGPVKEGPGLLSPKGLMLTVLLAIWAGLAVWVVSAWTEPQQVPLTHVSGQKAKVETVRSRTGQAKPGSDLKIHLELLTASRERAEKSFHTPKNIFAPVSPLMTDAPAPVVSPSAGKPPPAEPQPTPAELAQQAGRRELAQYRYLGYLTREGRDEVFLAKGNYLYILGAGESVDQKIVVQTITPTNVTLEDTSAHVKQVVKLAGDAVSSAPMTATTVAPQPPIIETTQALPPPAAPSPPAIEVPITPAQPKTSM